MKSPKDLFPVDDGGTDRHIADLFINRNRRSLFADVIPAAGLEPQIGFGVAPDGKQHLAAGFIDDFFEQYAYSYA